MHDRYRFLDPWTLLLPQEGPCVLAVAGSGGKTTLLRRLHDLYRARGARVLWTQTVPHPAPVGIPALELGTPASTLLAQLQERGALFVAGPRVGEHPGGLTPADVSRLVARARADVVLVECHARTQTPLRADRSRPVWPSRCDRIFLTANLAAVGRPLSAQVMAGIDPPDRTPGEAPQRVTVEDVLETFRPPHGLLAQLPEGGLVVPFLTGFGSFRDMDGMFTLVQALWKTPRVRAVCLAELVGDERRDAAAARDLAPLGIAASADRVYAVYPAELDED